MDAHTLADRWGAAVPRRLVLCSMVAMTLVVALIGPNAALSFVSTCSPAINGARAPAPGKVIAPYLRVVKSSFGLGTCDTPISVQARSADGTLWGTGNRNNVWKSTDDISTWQMAYTAIGYPHVENVLPLASGHVLILVRDTRDTYHVLRSTDTSGTAFDRVPVLDIPIVGRLLGSQSWVETGGSIYIGEYGDPRPPVKLWQSVDDGQSFSAVQALHDVRHFHAVQADPYVSGRLWVTIGDTGPAPRIGYSDNGGHNFKFITREVYPRSRAVSLTFTPRAVYWATDTPDVPAGLYRWDRRTSRITRIMSGLNGPFYFAVSHRGLFAQFSGVERRVLDRYIGDQYYHVLSSRQGSSWVATRTSFMRAQHDSRLGSIIAGITHPDHRGRFWVNFSNLAGAQMGNANVEFRLDPGAAYRGVDASFRLRTGEAGAERRVSFDGSASSSPHKPLHYRWDYGDGSTATGRRTAHAYEHAGTYVARLQVTDARGDSAETARTVVVPGGMPWAAIGIASGLGLLLLGGLLVWRGRQRRPGAGGPPASGST